MQRKPITKPLAAAANNRSKSQVPKAKPKELKVGDEYCTKGQRMAAMGNIATCQDKLLKTILQNGEKLFDSKKIHTSGDWLVSHKEGGQTYDDYQKPGAKNTVTKQRSKIYIFVIDPSISADFLQKLKLYCEAFYTGMAVEIMTPKSPDFMESLEIPHRINDYSGMVQYNANVILKKIINMVPQDGYCMVTVTMQDLYPFDSWNYVFGWANYKSRCGVFSFGRYQAEFEEIDTQDPELFLLENACYVMVHEIGHMYGLLHCPFYECIMNGFNSCTEQNRVKRYLCPVCLRKLQSNMGFSVRKRFQDMQEICTKFGFQQMAEYYKKAQHL